MHPNILRRLCGGARSEVLTSWWHLLKRSRNPNLRVRRFTSRSGLGSGAERLVAFGVTVQHSDFAFSLQPRPPESTDRRALFQALQPVEISTGYHVVGFLYLL
jgi:hypothetical protein